MEALTVPQIDRQVIVVGVERELLHSWNSKALTEVTWEGSMGDCW